MIIEILGEEIVRHNGNYKVVRRWLKGVHPELGTIVDGLTGQETLQEVEVAVPEIEIVGEEVIGKYGTSFKRVRRWLRGIHPELGILVQGVTGWETLQEIDVIEPIKVFQMIF